jgi:cation diffusion facilitator family transporter
LGQSGRAHHSVTQAHSEVRAILLIIATTWRQCRPHGTLRDYMDASLKVRPMASPSKASIYAALIGNVAVGVAKLGAFFLSGSSAMLVEAIHSVIDTLNQGLLLFGINRSARPPDAKHPFGYGLEAYFWTFVVALLIFAAGGVVSIYQGVQKLLHPTKVGHVPLALGVIALCTLFEFWSLFVSMREAERGRPATSRKRYPKISFLQSIHFSADPGVFEVLAEDAASILGLVVALLGIIGSAWFGWLAADGVAAITIGMMLIILAAIVVGETHSLLTGEAALPSTIAEAREILEKDPRIESVCEVLTMQLGPQEVLMAATLDFRDDLSGPQLEEAADELAASLKAADPRITRVFMRPGRSQK